MILAVLQARMSSSRLPGKVLSPVLGEPMLLRQIERIKRARQISQLIVATSSESSDDAIERVCATRQVSCFRGDLDDVLDRFYQIAKRSAAEHVVRLTADCPLIDPQLIDDVIELHLKGGFNYTSNAIERTFPDGLDVEVATFESLEIAWRESQLPSEREHVTEFIQNRPERFKLGHQKQSADMSLMRWTVDQPEDLDFVRAIYSALYTDRPEFNWKDVLVYLKSNPALCKMNAHFAGVDANLAVERILQKL